MRKRYIMIFSECCSFSEKRHNESHNWFIGLNFSVSDKSLYTFLKIPYESLYAYDIILSKIGKDSKVFSETKDGYDKKI